MTTKEYNSEVKKWIKWDEECKRYTDRHKQLIKTIGGRTLEECQEIKRILEAEFGNENDLWFGPWTKIYSVSDLMNPNFILPGMSESFLAKPYAEKVIEAWGKEIESELGEDFNGKVVGYAYDAGDDYLIIDKGDGQEVYMILNSHWKIKEDN